MIEEIKWTELHWKWNLICGVALSKSDSEWIFANLLKMGWIIVVWTANDTSLSFMLLFILLKCGASYIPPSRLANKASPPGRHQEQAPKQRCTFRPTTYSSVQFSTPVGYGRSLSVQFSLVQFRSVLGLIISPPFLADGEASLDPLRSVQFSLIQPPGRRESISGPTSFSSVQFNSAPWPTGKHL